MPEKDLEKKREQARRRRARHRERAKVDPEFREKMLSEKRAYYQRYRERERVKARDRARLNPVRLTPSEKARRKVIRQSLNPVKDSHVKCYRRYLKRIEISLHDSHVKTYKKTGRYQYRSYRKNCPKHKCKMFIYNSLARVLSRVGKDLKTPLGYNKSDLMHHIESKFEKGMSWDNYGRWHIDHIVSIKSYIDSGVTCPKTINALSNLQPLWAGENIRKGG